MSYRPNYDHNQLVCIPVDKIGDAAVKAVSKKNGVHIDIVDKIHSHQWKVVYDGLESKCTIEVTKFCVFKVVKTAVFKLLAAAIDRKKLLEYIWNNSRDTMSSQKRTALERSMKQEDARIAFYNSKM